MRIEVFQLYFEDINFMPDNLKDKTHILLDGVKVRIVISEDNMFKAWKDKWGLLR